MTLFHKNDTNNVISNVRNYSFSVLTSNLILSYQTMREINILEVFRSVKTKRKG